jgi:hypothetical protein
MRRITVNKLDIHGNKTWQYHGQLLHQDQGCITLEAYFDREDTSFFGMPLRKGDRFLETYYTDRWYNIFEVHARDDDHLRGWYCNIGKPARFDGKVLSYVDLALDLLIFPDGRQIVLDEAEFTELEITDEVRVCARDALNELQAIFQQRISPPPPP